MFVLALIEVAVVPVHIALIKVLFVLALLEVPVVPVHIALIKVLLVLYTQHCRGGCGYSVMQNTAISICTSTSMFFIRMVLSVSHSTVRDCCCCCFFMRGTRRCCGFFYIQCTC